MSINCQCRNCSINERHKPLPLCLIYYNRFTVSLAIFDLDNTLIADDSDFLWGQYLVDHGIVDRDYYEHNNKRFYEEYQQGTLDIEAFLEFSLAPLALHDTQQLYRWREHFVATIIEPLVLHAARALVDKHRAQGDTLLVISATNRFITDPICKLFGIDNLLATTPELVNGRYTGKFVGVPCYQAGKVRQLEDWLKGRPETLAGSWFYSDSHNDLPLLNLVTHPVAVDPDDMLFQVAKQANWPIISLRT